ncbi:MAG: hypothetical protein HC904_08200, partial [Blastochloris sp.]|nr:hypothetical protein [Blastochloris sp.]
SGPALVIFCPGCWVVLDGPENYWQPTGGKVAMIFVGLCVVLFLGLIHAAVRRWEREEAAEGALKS